MKDNSYSYTLITGKKNEFKLKTLGKHRNEIHYIGISVDMVRYSLKGKLCLNIIFQTTSMC